MLYLYVNEDGSQMYVVLVKDSHTPADTFCEPGYTHCGTLVVNLHGSNWGWPFDEPLRQD